MAAQAGIGARPWHRRQIRPERAFSRAPYWFARTLRRPRPRRRGGCHARPVAGCESQAATSLRMRHARSIAAFTTFSRRGWIGARSSIRCFVAYSSWSTCKDGPREVSVFHIRVVRIVPEEHTDSGTWRGASHPPGTAPPRHVSHVGDRTSGADTAECRLTIKSDANCRLVGCSLTSRLCTAPRRPARREARRSGG
jgi:hypothetical protein